MIAAIVDELAPNLVARNSVGHAGAAQLLLTAGDNPERLRSEAGFASLCGVSPVPASSGKTVRHRLNRGGDRAANSALHIIAIGRLRTDQRTKDYVARRMAFKMAARLVVELTIGEEDMTKLMAIARSRTETASRVERSRMLLAYQDDPSFFAVGRALGVHNQTVRRCVERAVAFGPLAALDDSPRPGKEATITPEAKTWLVSLACRKAKDLGYPHELWTTRLLARHAREHGLAAGHR